MRRSCALVLALLAGGGAVGEETVVSVKPGGVVSWTGRGVDVCRLGERAWEPLGGTCYFPIDLLASPGPLIIGRRSSGVEQRLTVTVAEYPYPLQRLTIEDESKVHLSTEAAARVARENQRLEGLWLREMRSRFTLPLFPPLGSEREGGRFGARRVINGEPRSPHTGVDYSAPAGTPVFAAAAGVVVMVDDLFFSGKSVFVDHGGGLITMYFHLSRTFVEAGSDVARGQRIGLVGATGRATGPHLHFGVRWHGSRVDPMALLGASSEITKIRF